MPSDSKKDLKARVIRAADAALAAEHIVGPIDVLLRMGLLTESAVDAWKKGRFDRLDESMQGSEQKLTTTFTTFTDWARTKGLRPTERRFTRAARTGAADLQVSHLGPDFERFFRTHYISADLPEKKQQQIVEKVARGEDPVVFDIVNESQCSECGVELGRGNFLFMDGGEPLCLQCANLAQLEFLPAGDAALTRRSTKYSTHRAVVVRFSRSRGRYERQGILLEPSAIEKAEQECLADAGERAKARAAGALKRMQDDATFVTQIIERVGTLFPGCPVEEAAAIATHTAARGSGRVGRSAAGRSLEGGALMAAVTAAVRHNRTNYDQLLAQGMDRSNAREHVYAFVQATLEKWRKNLA